MSRTGPGRDVTAGHGRGAFRRKLEHLSMESCDSAARNQSVARNKFVAIVLGSVSALRSTDRVGKLDPVRIGKAEYQSSKAPKVQGQEAAHPVPGHVWIANRDITLLAPNQQARNMLLDLFSYCNHVPLLVNDADSLAESGGLRSAFAEACRYVIQWSAVPGQFRIDTVVVENAYRQVWCAKAGAAYASAIASIETNHPTIRSLGPKQLPDGTIELPEKGPSEEELKAWVKRNVLQIYLRDLSSPPNRLERTFTAQLEMTFKTGKFYAI